MLRKQESETPEEKPEEETTEEETAEEEKPEEEDEAEEEKPEAEAEEKPEEESTEEAAEKAAKAISAHLGLDKLQKTVNRLEKMMGERTDLKSKLYGLEDTSKGGVKKLSKEEKIVAFFGALIRDDRVALKALSEGVAADGGYLVPDEFRAELIRDIPEISVMRGLVRVVPMKRDVMKIPKLVSRPQVRWTSENATKSTTTADFTEKTLTAYKVAAILYTSDELVEDATDFNIVSLITTLFSERIAEEEDKVITQGTGVGQPTGLTNCTISSVACSGNLDSLESLSIEKLKENAVNCWELLKRTISSQAKLFSLEGSTTRS